MKKHRTFVKFLVGIMATAIVASCADGPSSPNAAAKVPSAQTQGYNVPAGRQASQSLLGSIVGALTSPVSVVTRDVPLRADITVSTEITPQNGGQIRIPEAGFTVIIPPHAVAYTQTISVTALAGNLVAYDFGPAGSTFLKPLHINQKTHGTDAGLLRGLLGGLHAGYFKNNGQLNFQNATGLVDDLLPTTLDDLLGQADWDITHFSGYLLCTGRQ
jgi:hypothetical protein